MTEQRRLAAILVADAEANIALWPETDVAQAARQVWF
jgi:hypothetical protein